MATERTAGTTASLWCLTARWQGPYPPWSAPEEWMTRTGGERIAGDTFLALLDEWEALPSPSASS